MQPTVAAHGNLKRQHARHRLTQIPSPALLQHPHRLADEAPVRPAAAATDTPHTAKTDTDARFRRGGACNYPSILSFLVVLLAAEQQLASSATQASTNLVQLYKALGGGWENSDLPDQVAAAPDSKVQRRPR